MSASYNQIVLPFLIFDVTKLILDDENAIGVDLWRDEFHNKNYYQEVGNDVEKKRNLWKRLKDIFEKLVRGTNFEDGEIKSEIIAGIKQPVDNPKIIHFIRLNYLYYQFITDPSNFNYEKYNKEFNRIVETDDLLDNEEFKSLDDYEEKVLQFIEKKIPSREVARVVTQGRYHLSSSKARYGSHKTKSKSKSMILFSDEEEEDEEMHLPSSGKSIEEEAKLAVNWGIIETDSDDDEIYETSLIRKLKSETTEAILSTGKTTSLPTTSSSSSSSSSSILLQVASGKVDEDEYSDDDDDDDDDDDKKEKYPASFNFSSLEQPTASVWDWPKESESLIGTTGKVELDDKKDSELSSPTTFSTREEEGGISLSDVTDDENATNLLLKTIREKQTSNMTPSSGKTINSEDEDDQKEVSQVLRNFEFV